MRLFYFTNRIPYIFANAFMEKGFRRIALTLIILSLITAGLAGVYLWYNFNARSSLPVIVPENAWWMYHFQTRKTEKSVSALARQGKIPPKPAAYADSLRRVISSFPIFTGVSDPAEPGIAVRSDVVIWQSSDGWFLALSVVSEPRLKEFCSARLGTEITGKLLENERYYWLKARRSNMYFAFKHKACVFFVPADTSENAQKAEAALNRIFDPKARNILENKTLQDLYDSEPDIVFLSNEAKFGLSHSISFDNAFATIYYPGRTDDKSAPSPLFLFKKAGVEYSEDQIGNFIDKQNRITTTEYLNQSFKTAVQYLKPFIQ